MAGLDLVKPNSYNIVLVGKTGTGKSATGNTILGRIQFKSYLQSTSGTIKCQLESTIVGNVILNVIDTPGLMDTGKTKEEIERELLEIMTLCPDGFHAFFFVLKSNTRFTQEEIETVNQIKSFFGPTFIKCCIIAFTNGDGFDMDDNAIPFTEWLKLESGEMKKFIRDCDNRCILFYNTTKYPFYEVKRKETVSKLVQLIQEQKILYTDKHFKEAVDIRRTSLIKHKLPQLDAGNQQQLSLIIADLEKGENLENVVKRIKSWKTSIGEKNLKIPVKLLIDALLLVRPENKEELVEIMTKYFTLLKNPPSILSIAIPLLAMVATAVGGLLASVVTLFIPPVALAFGVGTASVVGANAAATGFHVQERIHYNRELRLCEDKIQKFIANTAPKSLKY